ncbi:MAG: ComEC/Rec2 family competence protein, partial [Rhizobiales bacterium]|nr:ComEC/Rec2 family competence protein [Hyphomicrobiales bacterium]
MITGDRSFISRNHVEMLRASGLAHVLAISGLHMTLVTGALFAGLRALLAFIPGIALRYPIKKIAAFAALFAGAFYLALSGANVATQRAFIMVGIMLVAILLERPAISLRNVALAALFVILWRPESVVTASFQMSFAAVTALIAAYEYVLNRRSAKKDRHFTG